MKVNPELISSYKELPSGKKIYFASDFHLGIPNKEDSQKREQKIVKWLEHVSKDASAIFLLGDVFDFWFEYALVIPKGFIRFQGKLAELKDRGIPIHLFVGNHDLWMRDYFSEELDIPVHHHPIVLEVGDKKLFIGHGDGLGPGDRSFKITKKIFTNLLCNWIFKWIHPDIGIALANYWSKKSRVAPEKEKFTSEDNECLLTFCKQVQKSSPHHYYIFGHRHLPLELPVDDNSTYFNLGEWISQCNYLEFDGHQALLKSFED
ncbi:UDP-2,3-diacylglucosamine diphosphatase [Ekhidna sp.]|jgi:UDP-2,3-diacylglucosamine hydrolase|uniref:UDP-2,3-diacylglucosamine diphosphatase n=1 Tax=Ekhidna sp. TaxID=2608089 RepID=UPI0032ED11E1